MSTSRGDSETNVNKNRQRFLNKFNVSVSKLAQPLQVGGDRVQVINTPGDYPGLDALITADQDIYLRILTADCAPILIWSLSDRVVAAVHSGWQGSELNILGKTLSMMERELGTDPKSLCVAIGPGLTQENFEVGPEFGDKFDAQYLQPVSTGSKFLFNNNNYLRDTAIQAGVPRQQIEILPFCSYKDDHLFFSHRRDQGVTGRMMSIIGINP